MEKEKSLLKTFAGTAGLRISGQLCTIVSGIFFARLLGPEEYGKYSLILSIIAISVLPATAGLPELIIREISKYRVGNKCFKLNGILAWSLFFVLVTSTVCCVILMALSSNNFFSEEISSLLIIGIALIPIRALLVRQSAVINAFKYTELSQFPSMILAPFILLILVLFLFFFGIKMDSLSLVYMQVITASIACLVGFILLKHVLNKEGVINQHRAYNIKSWHKSLLPFTLLVVVGVMNNELGILALGIFSDSESVAFFKVASQGGAVLAIGLQTASAVTGPRVVRLYHKGDLLKTQKLLDESVKLSSYLSLPAAFLLIFFGEYLIGLLFGDEYGASSKLLTILCFGQIFNILSGSVGMVLNMTGNESYTLKTQLFTLLVTLLLLLVLVPRYHEIGAAISISTSLILWNIIMAYNVYRLTGLKTWFRFS